MAKAQNLVPNASFEAHSECPSEPNTGDDLLAPPWRQGNAASADYFHMCGSGQVDVPDNWFGFQFPIPVSDSAYAGLIPQMPSEYREYLQAPLTEPLVAGTSYMVSFHISLAENRCGIRPFGALFTIGPAEYDFVYPIETSPQVEVNGEYLSDTQDWIQIARCFIAEGGENYITLGNFRNNADTPLDPDCDHASSSYYYVDSVSVVAMPLSEEEFILEPATECGSYEIFPGTAQNYLWSDGTTNPTLTVNESGTYYVTLSDECAFSYGEIEVTILPDAPPVSLPSDTMLCTGELIEISLDPEAGTYAWQDGSTESDYNIATEGEYIVELTDDCDVTSDTINVSFIDPPQPFSLGEDTLICDGDAFIIFFDPLLGDFEWQDGSNGSSLTISEEGTYALTISNSCGETSDEIEVSFVEEIIFDLGPEQMTLCDGDELEIELDPELGDFLWHDDSEGNTFTITEGGTVSVTISNACSSVFDEMFVDVIYQPQFSLGPDITVCSGQFPFSLDMSDVEHAQSWLWTGGSTESVFTAPGTYSVTISNDCFSLNDEIVVSVGDVDPVVTLPSDQQLCPGQTLVLDAGGLMGSYQWQDFSTADTFLVTQPGQYMLTVTTSCGSGADTIVVDYVPALSSPDLGPDFSLCPGETGVLYANVDNVSYLWSESTAGTIGTADSIVIASAGVYALQINDACSSASDTVVVSINANPPDVDLPSAMSLCQGDTVVIDAGITGVSYLWQDFSVGSQYVAIQPGNYSVTVTNACGTDTDSVIVADAGPSPFLELGEDVSICPGDQVTITPLAFDVDAWLWHDGSEGSTLNVESAGVVHVDVFNDCGQASDTILVTVLPETPVFDLGTDAEICPGEIATFSISVANVDIEWSDNSTDNNFTTSSPGPVFATISNACGSFSDTAQVVLLPAIPDLSLGNDQSLCPGETITLTPGILDVDYLWQDGSEATTYTTTVAGQIILIITNDCGSSSDTLDIIADTNGPQLDLGPDILACEGDTVVIEVGISGVDYLWHDGTVASEHLVTLSGQYHLTVSNACGMDSDTISVDIHGSIPEPNLGSDTTLCDNEVLTLVADPSNTIEWQDGSDASTFVVEAPGTFFVTETNHCGVGSDTINIYYQNSPTPFDLGADFELCAGDSVVLFAPVTMDQLMWQDGSSEATFIANQSQLYSLVISNDCGNVSDDILVTIDTQVPVVELGADQELCAGQSLSLNADQEFFSSYLWSTGSTQPSIVITQPDVYAVTVMTDCYAVSDEVLIEEDLECDVDSGIYIPNVFSPNGDGVNDEWIVSLSDVNILGVQCRIFDRWGELVHETSTIPPVWDGKFGRESLMPGVYAYLIEVFTLNGSQIISGDLTLLQ